MLVLDKLREIYLKYTHNCPVCLKNVLGFYIIMGLLNKPIVKKYILPIVCLLLLGSVVTISVINKKPKSSSINIAELAKPTATFTINAPFSYELTDPKGGKIFLKYTLVDAKKVGMVTQQNQVVKLKSDEAVMILNLELQNDSTYPLKVNSQDFVRMIGEEDKKYAPDFYNGELDVAPISVKKDQLAFIIKKDTQNIKLLVGDATSKDKQTIDISF